MYHPISITDVEAPLRRGMSDKTMEASGRRAGKARKRQRARFPINKGKRTPILLLFSVTVVLLIACANTKHREPAASLGARAYQTGIFVSPLAPRVAISWRNCSPASALRG
jgi:hypothetical protein